jgi:hypothetical protein
MHRLGQHSNAQSRGDELHIGIGRVVFRVIPRPTCKAFAASEAARTDQGHLAGNFGFDQMGQQHE